MALNGTAWAGYGNAFAAYLMGDEPDELTPVDGGSALPFVHESESQSAEATESGLIVGRRLVVFVTGSRPEVGTRYTWSGETWQVARADADRCAGVDWPCRVELVAHARQVKAS